MRTIRSKIKVTVVKKMNLKDIFGTTKVEYSAADVPFVLLLSYFGYID